MFSITNYLHVLLLLAQAQSVEEIEYSVENAGEVDIFPEAEFILCRGCGSDITSTSFIIRKPSPFSLLSFNDTIFTEEKVLVQLLSSDIFFHFPVFTSVHSDCIGIGEWEEQDSWFPGYRFRPCICPDCGAYVGFAFEPVNIPNPTDKFFGLILTTLIAEPCK